MPGRTLRPQTVIKRDAVFEEEAQQKAVPIQQDPQPQPVQTQQPQERQTTIQEPPIEQMTQQETPVQPQQIPELVTQPVIQPEPVIIPEPPMPQPTPEPEISTQEPVRESIVKQAEIRPSAPVTANEESAEPKLSGNYQDRKKIEDLARRIFNSNR